MVMVGPRCALEAKKVFDAFDYPHKISGTDRRWVSFIIIVIIIIFILIILINLIISLIITSLLILPPDPGPLSTVTSEGLTPCRLRWFHSVLLPSEPFLVVTGAPTEEALIGPFEREGVPYKRYERAEDVPGPLGFD
jgi:uncharacterized SAM-binding protein YcdF (DUF218 family)